MSASFGNQLLIGKYDGLLLDLDGTVYRGSTAIHGAVEILERVGIRRVFMTNNASRSSGQVAEQLHTMGFAVGPGEIVTSAQTAARMLAENLGCGSKVLVIGTDALVAEMATVGLVPVRSEKEGPVAVVQGHSPNTDWNLLAEAALAIRDGALWVACNADATFPTERGLVPGNGSMVAALRAATDAAPYVVGKPQPHMVREGLERGCFKAPLVVGDRLETDIAGASAVGLPSLLVLSGVSTASDVIFAGTECRPTYLAEDIRGLVVGAETLRVGPQWGWHVEIGDDTATVSAVEDQSHEGLSIVRAVAHALWQSDVEGRRRALVAGDALSRRALADWDLLDA